MMDSAAYFLMAPPAGSPPSPLTCGLDEGRHLGSSPSLADISLADHNGQQQQAPLSQRASLTSSSPFLANYTSSSATTIDSFCDPFGESVTAQTPPSPAHLFQAGDFFVDDQHLCGDAVDGPLDGRCDSPLLIGMHQFTGVLAIDDDLLDRHQNNNHHLQLRRHNHHHHQSHHLSLDHNHRHHNHNGQLNQNNQLNHLQQQQHLNNLHFFQVANNGGGGGAAVGCCSLVNSSQDSSLAFMSAAMSGSLSSGSSDCSLSLGNGTSSTSIYDDPADIIAGAHSADFYTNYYNLNDCLQSDILLTTSQQQQQQQHSYTSSDTLTATATASTSTTTQTTASGLNSASGSSEKRSVLMNLLLDGSDIGAGYTSINCRALRNSCATNNIYASSHHMD